MSSKAVTANRLTDGSVVYLTDAGAWSEWLNEAALAGDEEGAERLLERGRADTATGVVEPYLIEVIETDGLLAPLRYREVLRARGPSTHPNHGKQAQA